MLFFHLSTFIWFDWIFSSSECNTLIRIEEVWDRNVEIFEMRFRITKTIHLQVRSQLYFVGFIYQRLILISRTRIATEIVFSLSRDNLRTLPFYFNGSVHNVRQPISLSSHNLRGFIYWQVLSTQCDALKANNGSNPLLRSSNSFPPKKKEK